LVGLQTLALEHVEQPAFRLGIVAMHQTDVAGVTIFGQRPANDHLEIALPVFPVADIAAVKADYDPSFRDRQLLPFRRATVDEAGPLLPEFGFRPLGHMQDMLAQCGGVRARRDRQDVGQQPRGSGIRNQ
jgi:hypothetical protein